MAALTVEQVLSLPEENFVGLFTNQLQRFPVVRDHRSFQVWDPSKPEKGKASAEANAGQKSGARKAAAAGGGKGSGLDDHLFQSSLDEIVRGLNTDELRALQESVEREQQKQE